MKSSPLKKDLNTYILTRQEHHVMRVIWELGGGTTREVHSALSRKHALAYTTVLTFMRILQQKGILERRPVGRTHHYRAVLTRERALKNQVCEVLVSYFESNPKRLIKAIQEDSSKSE
jgi:BlaI family penicillinase repressor